MAEKLPGQFQAELVHVAREAFTSSFRLTSVIAAVIVSGISIMVVLLLKRAHGTSAAEPS